MARPKKELTFSELFKELSDADLKLLKKEVATEQKNRSEAAKNAKAEELALKVRDKIRIGSKITFSDKKADGGFIKTEVTGIFADKVQVEVNGRKRAVSLVKITKVD